MKKIYNSLMKGLICIMLFLILAIFSNKDIEVRKGIKNLIYDNNFSFSYFRGLYNKYLGGIFPIEDHFLFQVHSVFRDDLVYQNISDYEDGAILNVNQDYVVPSIQSGIVVYIGEKEKYQNVIIIEGDDGVDVWYGNLCNITVQLYDNIDKGTYLGEVCDHSLYLVFSKGNTFIDYHKYL